MGTDDTDEEQWADALAYWESQIPEIAFQHKANKDEAQAMKKVGF